MRVAAPAAETEVEAPGGENEVPAELLEVHLDLVNTAGLVAVLLCLGSADIPGSSGVTLVSLGLVLTQLLLSCSSYELPRSGEEFLHEPLEDVFSPEHSDLLAG